MKKISALLAFLTCVSITHNSFSMIRQLLRTRQSIPNRRMLTRHYSTHDSQGVTDDTFNVLELSHHVDILDAAFSDKKRFDLQESGNCLSPWHYYTHKDPLSIPCIESWTNSVCLPYKEKLNEFCSDIEQTLNKQLPSWLDIQAIREINNTSKNFVEENIVLINYHHHFLLRHRQALLELESKKSLYRIFCKPFIKKYLENELITRSHDLNHRLEYNNRIISDKAKAMQYQIHRNFYKEKEKRKKTVTE